jgi:hypothetical protein
MRCNALPEAGAGFAPGRNISRDAVGSRKPPTAASCWPALTRSPPGESRPPGCACAQSSPDAPASWGSVPPCKPPPCDGPPNISRSMLCPASRCSHRAGMAAHSSRQVPPGLIAGCWPGKREAAKATRTANPARKAGASCGRPSGKRPPGAPNGRNPPKPQTS